MSSKVIASQLKQQALSAQSVTQLLVQRLSQSPKTIQIIDGSSGRYTTRQQVLDYGLNFAAYLVDECGVGAGDVVLFVTVNSDIHAIGITGVLYAAGELQDLIEQINPKVLVLDQTNYEVLAKIGSEYNIKTLVLNKYENELSVEEILQMSRPDTRKTQLPVPTDLDTTITYVMTSGSTGRPKAVRRTNRNHLSTVAVFAHKELCPLTADDILLNCGFCHICGQRSLLSAIDAGAALLVLACDETHDEVFEAINKFGATAALLVPTQLNYLVKNPQ
ncbi:unnamed protein product, partial [Oppiella nova]